MMNTIIDRLLASEEPSVRYKMRVNVLGQDPASESLRQLQSEIKASPRVSLLLAERNSKGRTPYKAYNKWYGAHWVLSCLADIGYPPGDESLIPMCDQVLENWLSETHNAKIKTIEGRVRRCASQEGNALYSVLSLGLADERADELAERLVRWQWPDGGWNCDKKPPARHSSFYESLIPLRALALYARLKGSGEAQTAAGRTAEFFLCHHLYKRETNGEVINPEFTELHYPCYWRYDILFGLKVMAEAGFIHDPRCGDALDLLESKRLAGGGFPAEQKYYRVTNECGGSCSRVSWGPTSRVKMNEFVTVDALSVLKAAGRL
jgi:hypothetical protein